MRQPNSILMIHTAFLGDMVLLSSLFRVSRHRFPDARIVAVLSPIGAELYESNPWNIEILVYDKRGKDRGIGGWIRLRHRIRRADFDWCLSLHRYFRSTALALFSGARQKFGFKDAWGSLFFNGRVARENSLYEAEKNLSVLQIALSQNQMDPIQINPKELYPELILQREDLEKADEVLPDRASSKYILISPSSVWATKCWPVDRYIAVAKKLYDQGLSVVFVGGKGAEDIRAAQAIEEALSVELTEGLTNRHHWMKNLIGKTSISALRGIIAHADLVVGNDSAPMHIATAFDRRTISIFGPTTKALGFFPLSKTAEAIVIEQRLECRPCGLHGHKTCPLRHFHCMLKIEESKVIRTVESVLCP